MLSLTWLRAGCPTSCLVQESSDMACAIISTFPPKTAATQQQQNVTPSDNSVHPRNSYNSYHRVELLYIG